MFGTPARSGFRRGCGRASCAHPQTLLTSAHDSGALTDACRRKGPQMANPRPTPKPENLRPPWPPGTSGNPAGYSRGRRISDAIERLIEEMALDREFGARQSQWRWARNTCSSARSALSQKTQNLRRLGKAVSADFRHRQVSGPVGPGEDRRGKPPACWTVCLRPNGSSDRPESSEK